MPVTVEFAGEGTREVEVGEDAVFRDLLADFDVSIHEVTMLVDGRPVPGDEPVPADADRVQIVRLVQGG